MSLDALTRVVRQELSQGLLPARWLPIEKGMSNTVYAFQGQPKAILKVYSEYRYYRNEQAACDLVRHEPWGPGRGRFGRSTDGQLFAIYGYLDDDGQPVPLSRLRPLLSALHQRHAEAGLGCFDEYIGPVFLLRGPILDAFAVEVGDVVDRFVRALPKKPVAVALHSDVRRPNLRATRTGLRLIDFDEFAPGPGVLDWAQAAIEVSPTTLLDDIGLVEDGPPDTAPTLWRAAKQVAALRQWTWAVNHKNADFQHSMGIAVRRTLSGLTTAGESL
jgi:hypothetical protein